MYFLSAEYFAAVVFVIIVLFIAFFFVILGITRVSRIKHLAQTVSYPHYYNVTKMKLKPKQCKQILKDQMANLKIKNKGGMTKKHDEKRALVPRSELDAIINME